MVGGTGVYVTWVTGAIIASLVLMPFLKPPWARITLTGFQDMFRRYWMHGVIVFSIYIWKDIFDGIDRILMANTRIDMTAYIYAVEGDIVLWFQQTFENELLTLVLTHFYVAGYMMIIFCAFVYTCYFDDRQMADRISLTLLLTYLFALPFYLFFNVRVTGDYIPEMQTLGYHLTPEIQTWFTRIDPFTNGMPSLHIGMPFAIWYCYARNDLDGRWKRWRYCLIGYTIMTSFTILYLGIHWVLDIIGGIAVGILAVHVSERIAPSVWWWLDERSFLHRVSWLLADWRRPLKEIQTILSGWIGWFRVPGSRQTGVVIMLLLAGTGGTLLWDATHQHFPAEGVTHPGVASGADGWLASYEVIDDGNITVTMWNLSTEESYQSNITLRTDWGHHPVEILIGESHIVVWHGYELEFFNLSKNQWEGQWLTGPMFDDIAMLSNGDDDWPRMVMLNDGEVEIRLRGGVSCSIENQCFGLPTSPNGPVSMIAADDNRVAYVEADTPLSIHVQTIDGIQSHITVEIDSMIDEERDEQVFQMTDSPVDYLNATVTEISLGEGHLVALVNLSVVDRLVLVDLSNGEQRILGDPVFPVAAPSIGHGYVAWQHHQFLISNNPLDMYLDWEVDYHDIAANQSYQLHTEDEIDQIEPQVMQDHIAWLQVDENNETEIRIFTLEVVLEPYSSSILQLSIILLPLLLLTWTAQRLKENEGNILSSRRTPKHGSETPDVSVIIPYHKDRGYLSEAIESYENQIFSGTSELILSHGPEKSLGGNFNEGIRKANGKYVKVLPDDDLLTPNCLQDLFDAACENDADLVFAQARNFAGKGVEKISKSPVVNDMTLQALIENNFIHAITTLYRTEMLVELGGFDVSMWTAEEYEFHLRCLASGYKPYFVPSIVCEYREWEGSKSRVYRLQRKQERLDYIEQIREKFRSQRDSTEEE